MAALEQVTQLKNQGMSDDEIVSNLQQQGLSPKEITDAINQANIKNAVSGEAEAGADYPAPSPTPSGIEQGAYTPATEEMAAAPNAGGEYGAANQGYYPAETGYAGGAGMDSSAMIDIANQVFSEKNKKIQDQIDDLNEFKTMTKTKVDSIDDRLKKIEKMIDALQIKILEKVSAFGRDIESTKKEVSMVEDSIGKLTGKMAGKKSHAKSVKKKSASKKKR